MSKRPPTDFDSPLLFTLAYNGLPDWRQVHEHLDSKPWHGCTLMEAGGMTLYHYCVHKAFGHGPDELIARHWQATLITKLQPLPSGAWNAGQLDQACLLAWLDADTADGHEGLACPEALLEEMDDLLGYEALRLLTQGDPTSRHHFFQVLRYFTLRASEGKSINRHLQIALDTWPGCLGPPPRLLSLVQGTAAELIVCIRLAKAGFEVAALTQYVRDGVRQLLTTRQPVDFERNRYAVFPDQPGERPGEYEYSAELNWSHGDLGQAILLYEAQTLMPDAELVKFGDLVGLHTLLRTTTPATEVVSAPLYRGAAGVAQRYRQLYRLNQQPAYLQGYEFWLEQTRNRLWGELAVGDYPFEDSLRFGLTGIGLVLLSASTDVELGWDELLLGAG